MKYWQGIIMYIIALVFQPFLYGLFPGLGVTPNLILCLTVVLSFLFDEPYIGLTLGLVFGIISDVLYGQYVGPGSTAIVLVAVAIILIKVFTNVENFLNIIMVTICSTWGYASIYWLIYKFLGSPYGYLFAMKSLPWQLLFNCIIVIVLYVILIKRAVRYRKDRYFR